MSEDLANTNMRWSIGSVAVERVEENILPLPTKVLVPDITVEQIDAQRPWVNPYFFESNEGENGVEPVLRLSIHSFVVRSGDTVIVVDTCVGPDPDRGLQGDPAFLDRLADSLDGGLDSVDVVVCTHLHFDHVGWNAIMVDGTLVPAFPNARYLITAAEMAELERDDDMLVREPSIQPLIDAGVLDVIEVPDEGYHITDEVLLVSTPGHTPGHVSVLIRPSGADSDNDDDDDNGNDDDRTGGGESGSEAAALITGDAFHNPLQFAYPELAAWRFDSDSEQSTVTRQRMLDEYVDTNTLLLGTHFAPPTAGHLRRGDTGVWFEGAAPDGG